MLDLDAALRRWKPERRLKRLVPRHGGFAMEVLPSSGRPAVMLDTNVYIRSVAGTLPAAVSDLIGRSLLFHSTVCMAELATGIACFDPAAQSWQAVRDHYTALFAAIPQTRLVVPDSQTWLDAGVVAGILTRTQGYQRHQRKECLNDALILLSAAKAGLPVLTADRDDFDLIRQLAPEGRVLSF